MACPNRAPFPSRCGSRALAKAALTTAIFLGVVASSSSASAFCRNTTCKDTDKKTCLKDENGCVSEGKPLFWPTSCIEFHMNRDGTQFLDITESRTAIMKSFRSWSAVDCGNGKTASMTFVALEDIACKRAEYNRTGKNVNVILFQDNDWKYRGIDGTLAKTNATFDTETGEIFDADIEINTAFNKVTTSDEAGKIQFDLQAILTHEVGHFLGIGHSAEERATMFPSYSPGTVAIRQLSTDDKAAVCAAYPPNNGVKCNQEPRGGYSATCDDTTAAEPPGGCSVSSSLSPGSPVSPVSREAGGTTAVFVGLLSFVSFAFGRRGFRRRFSSERFP